MIKLGTKAESLERIYGRLTSAEVLPQITFTVADWKKSHEECLKRVLSAWGTSEVIVRSSALNEDTKESSQAGKYESIGNVRPAEKNEMMDAVNKVIHSFDDKEEKNQILIQPMLSNVKFCGVAFTLEPNTLGNYYVVSYDETGSTSAITSGTGTANKLLYVFKNKTGWSGQLSEPFKKLCSTLQELESLFGQNNLDIEFAVTYENKLYILQVRTLCVKNEAVDCNVQYKELRRIEEKIERSQSRKPFLCGEKTIYGVMPDWNPAEMIGIRPKPLAMSLYREIITDSVWAYQRDNYGYRNLRSFPLMVDFYGLPYIDIRVSFNSFVPAGLEKKISEKLVNYYIKRLEEDPVKHDKVEFDIVFSCYTLDLPHRIQILKQYGFCDDEIAKILDSLRDTTNAIIHHEMGLWRKDYEKIGVLEKRYKQIMQSDMDDIEKIYWLLEDCKRYGTLPFAGLARAAFIAVQILQSLVVSGVITQEDYQHFMKDVNTVSSDMNRDFFSLSRNSFLKKYGHLRPGTYDINSRRYDEEPELYFDWNCKAGGETTEKEYAEAAFRLSLEQLHMLQDILKENGLNDNVLELMDFIKNVIEGREYGKFIFTMNLSKAIQLIGKVGERYGISEEDCAYISIQTLKDFYTSTKDVETELNLDVVRGKEKYEITKAVTLPPLIMNPSDVWCFYYPDTEPNYITLKYTEGETMLIDANITADCIENKILLISSADPGYDWIFSHNIRGFITKYGGANSHMAIRAGELGIPAVIGVGTKQFEKYMNASMIAIDASTKMIRILK